MKKIDLTSIQKIARSSQTLCEKCRLTDFVVRLFEDTQHSKNNRNMMKFNGNNLVMQFIVVEDGVFSNSLSRKFPSLANNDSGISLAY